MMPQGPTFAADPQTTDVTDENFQERVLERSMELPVLVDFWAPWCGPCRTLGPTLDKVTGEMEGRVELVKVNVDENPGVAQALQIQSIPAVFLFAEGGIKDQFFGAYPEPEVRRFLETNLPSGEDLQAVDGFQLWEQGNLQGAAQVWSATLQSDADNAPALIGMGLVHLAQGNLEEAKAQESRVRELDLERLPDRQAVEKRLAGLRAHIFLIENVSEDEAPPAEGTLEAQMDAACRQALEGDYATALEGFLGIVQKDRKFRDDAGRKGMLAVFDILPAASELTAEYRTRLSNFLFR